MEIWQELGRTAYQCYGSWVPCFDWYIHIPLKRCLFKIYSVFTGCGTYVLLSISEHIKVPHRSISVISDSIMCYVCIFKPTAASHGDVYLVFLSFLGSVAMINSHFPATIYSAPHLSIQETPRRCLCTCHRLPRGRGGEPQAYLVQCGKFEINTSLCSGGNIGTRSPLLGKCGDFVFTLFRETLETGDETVQRCWIEQETARRYFLFVISSALLNHLIHSLYCCLLPTLGCIA